MNETKRETSAAELMNAMVNASRALYEAIQEEGAVGHIIGEFEDGMNSATQILEATNDEKPN